MSKRFFAGLTIAALGLVPLGGHADPAPEGCALVAGQGEASATITEGGAVNGIVGAGSWKVTIMRAGVTDPIVHERVHAVPEVLSDVFQPGDQITCVADEGLVVAGTAG